jgi:hypothetical protein
MIEWKAPLFGWAFYMYSCKANQGSFLYAIILQFLYSFPPPAKITY